MMNLEKRIFDFCIWLVAVCILLAVLTSCNPYMPATTTPTATANPNAMLGLPPPLPYWQLAALHPWQSIEISNSKAGH